MAGIVANIKGPQGTQGIQGVAGTPGTNGTDGTKLITGTGAPANTLGNNGDTYLNATTGDLYVKAGGVW